MVLSDKLAGIEPRSPTSVANKKSTEISDGQEQSWNVHNLIGQDYGNLRLLRLLGVGELGPVFLAKDRTSQSRLAVKVLRPDLNQPLHKIQTYFKIAQAVSYLETPHILPLKECHLQASGSHYVVMEALNGFLISDAIDTCMPIPLANKLEVALQVAKALATAHDQGIAHQCLSARNIFLVHRRNQNHCAKILDFGISELLLEPDSGESLKYQRDIQSYGRIFWDWVQSTSQSQSIPPAILEELKALFQQCIQAPPTHPNEFMGWICRELARISSTHQIENKPFFDFTDESIHSDNEIDWNTSQWKRTSHLGLNSRFAKIGLSVATIGLLAALTIFQVPFNANADRNPNPSEQIATQATTDHVVKGKQISATNNSDQTDERNDVEKQELEKTHRLSDSRPHQEEPSLIELKFSSSPMGAEVREVGSDVVLGITPFTIKISHDKRDSVFAYRKAGFLAATKKFVNQETAISAVPLDVVLKPISPIVRKHESPKAKVDSVSPFVADASPAPSAKTKTRSKPKRRNNPSSMTHKIEKPIKPNKKPSTKQSKPEIKKAPADQRAIIDPFAEE